MKFLEKKYVQAPFFNYTNYKLDGMNNASDFNNIMAFLAELGCNVSKITITYDHDHADTDYIEEFTDYDSFTTALSKRFNEVVEINCDYENVEGFGYAKYGLISNELTVTEPFKKKEESMKM